MLLGFRYFIFFMVAQNSLRQLHRREDSLHRLVDESKLLLAVPKGPRTQIVGFQGPNTTLDPSGIRE